MQQRVRLYNELPDPMDLENDLKRMDSGVKNDTEAYYIRQFYEAALDDYLNKVEIDRNYGRGIRTRERERPMDYQHRGIQMRREYDPYPIEPPRTYRGGGAAPTTWMEDELIRLRDDARKRDDEDRRRRDQENSDLKSQLSALQQTLQTGGGGGGGSGLEQKIEAMEMENKRTREQYEQLKEQTILERVQDKQKN